jgi:protein-S-isoprenylcysteine O-methyltransferase Ste14
MSLVQEFERSGNWLFKRRSWLPVLMVGAGIFVMYLGNRQAILFDMRDELIFLGISLFGEIIRVVTVGFAPGNTSGRNKIDGQVADDLNVTGIYSLLRHPLYIANFLIWLGPLLFIRSIWFILVAGLAYWLYYERIMFAEEQFLKRKFGDIYDKWSEKVSSVIPYSLKIVRPALPFSYSSVLKREYQSLFYIFLIFTLLDLSRNYFLSEHIYITPMWMYLALPSFLIWIALPVIRRITGRISYGVRP